MRATASRGTARHAGVDGTAAVPRWLTVEEMTRLSPLPPGYRYAALESADVPGLVDFLGQWFPGIAVGAGSCFRRSSFYRRHVQLADDPSSMGRSFLVMLIRHGDELVGAFAAQCDLDTLSLYGRVGAIAGPHRNRGLTEAVLGLSEVLARGMGLEIVFGLATLHVPFMQQALESFGFRLAGITPGVDREMVEPGVVKRVFEALYVKVLVDEADMHLPDPANLTPGTLALFSALYGAPGRAARAAGG